jgi:hypothetical protein
MMEVTKQVCPTSATLLTAQKSKHAMIPIQLTGILCSAPETFPGLAKKMQTDLKVVFCFKKRWDEAVWDSKVCDEGRCRYNI